MFEVLKADLEFVKSDKIVSKATVVERAKVMPAIRHAANSMFIRDPETKETVVYPKFKEALLGFVELNLLY